MNTVYPNIICTRNVSPDVTRCEYHRDRFPDLGYAIGDELGYLVDVLQPIIDPPDERKLGKRTWPPSPRLSVVNQHYPLLYRAVG